MNIGIIAPYSRPFDGAASEGSGQNTFIRQSALALAQRGHTVYLLRRKSRPTDRRQTKHGSRIIEIAVPSGPPQRLGRIETFRACARTSITDMEIIRDIDVVLAHYWVSAPWISQLLLQTTKRVVYFSHAFLYNPYRSAKESKAQSTAELMIAGLPTIYGVYTRSEKTWAENVFGKERVVYAPPGTGEIPLRPSRRCRDGVALFAGRKNHAKGYDLFCRLAKQHPEQSFAAIGRSTDGGSPASNVTETDVVSFPALMRKIRAAKVVVCPSRIEYFGLVPLMAVACGTPVLASRTGGHPDVIVHGRNGLLFTPDRFSALANAYEKFMRHPLILSQQEQRRICRAFRWDRWVGTIEGAARRPRHVFSGSILDVSVSPREVKDSIVNYECVRLPGSVHIIALDEDGAIVLVKEKKVHRAGIKTGLVSGIIDPGETSFAAARRELAEELGYRAGTLRLFQKVEQHDAVVDTRYYFLASRLRKMRRPHHSTDPFEDIKGEDHVSAQAIRSMLDDGVFGHASTAYVLRRFLDSRTKQLTSHVHHVALRVSNLKQSMQFYSSLLGCTPSKRFYSSNGVTTIQYLYRDDIAFELTCRSRPLAPDVQKKTIASIKHIAFSVKNARQVHRKVKACFPNVSSVKVKRVGEHQMVYFFVRDPDNIEVEFIENAL